MSTPNQMLPAATVVPSPTPARRATPRPSDEEIVLLVANHFEVDEATAYSWLTAFNRQEAA